MSEFKKLIEKEVDDYKFSLAKKGGSAPIILSEDIDLLVGKSEITVLSQAFINDELSEYQVYYIMDALLLSDKIAFESEGFKDVVEILTDPIVNGRLTKSTALEILSYCKS
ncbi:hypothetical protein [Emticicia sp. TH156]|uniref:hypothetical protein n=1 Tax=Emticicia sp. TH156 TaxID=2067454 RepID=UPI000C78986A|nr:hypothetical protein [Emticicia sp. TH156]